VTAARAEIIAGYQTKVLTYDGLLGGRLIRARAGRRVVVTQLNRTDQPVSVHLHGGISPSRYDGAPMDLIAPGRSKTYVYENEQPAAFLWRHDHAHHVESENVYRGMSSPYLITDSAERALRLPSGDHEIPLVLRDGAFDAQGQLVYQMDDALGRTVLSVNGKAWPTLNVEARKYRFRIVNASNLRFFVLALADGSAFTQIGGDAGLLPAPFTTPVVVVSPGERSDIVVDFSVYPAGTQLVLKNFAASAPTALDAEVMRFDVGPPTPDDSVLPVSLPAMPGLVPATVRRAFVLQSNEDGEEMYGTINGRTFDMDRIDTRVEFGTTEEWTIRSANTTRPHNFHTHLAHFRVLTRDGRPVGPDEAGWKDTVQVLAGQEVVIRLTFDRYRGIYPYHCHFIDHSAMGMMAQLEVV